LLFVLLLGEEIRITRKIRVNHNHSPLNFLRNKLKNKEKQEKHENKILSIEHIDEKIENMEELFDDELSSIKYEPNTNQNRLLQMMYLDDIDADFVRNKMGVSDKELENIVDGLVKLGLLEYSSDNEVQLTDEAIYYITSKDLEIF